MGLRVKGILSHEARLSKGLAVPGWCLERPSAVDHCHVCISGFYGQLQTFCPPQYPDPQRAVLPSSSCSVVPSFEDCLAPTPMGQAGFDVFHRAFSAHSGIAGTLMTVT